MSKKEVDNSLDVSAYSAGEPYVGPRPFKRDDRDIFFGRQRETLELTSLIKAHPELLIYAQSGAGKTSLIDAQLVPTLWDEEEFDVLPLARVRSKIGQSMQDDKIKNIYMFNALADLSADSPTLVEREQLTLAGYLEHRPRPPIGPPKETSEAPQAQTPAEIENQKQPRLARAIIFDQFEELFTLYPHRYKDRQDFFNQVRDALEADPFLRIVFSMREDYIAELDPYVDILPQKLSTRFRLERLRKPNALKAVTEPLNAKRIVNERTFADNTAEALVESLMLIKVRTADGNRKEVAGEFVDPVQLQVVCQTLWEQLPPDVNTITHEHLKKYANVDAALLTYYENSIRKAIKAASPRDDLTASGEHAASAVMEAKVRTWFEKLLITPEGKRNMIPRGEEDKGTGTRTTAVLPNDLVTELENQHLIRAETRGEDDRWYELSHDRLIAPIIESNRRWMLQQPWAKRKAEELEARRLQWFNAGKDPKLLLDREELGKANSWRESAEAQAVGWSTELDLFIRESQATIEAEEHKQVRLLALAQQERANAEHKRARQFRLGLVVASLLLLVASALGFGAYRAEGRATDALAAARKAEADARKAEAEAKQQRDKTKEALDDVQKAKDEVTAEKKRTEDALEKEQAAKALAKAETAKTIKAKGDLEKANLDLHKSNQDLSVEQDRGFSLLASDKIEQQLSVDPEMSLSAALRAAERWPDFSHARYGLRSAYVNWPNKHFVLRQEGRSFENALFTPDSNSIITTSLKKDGSATVEVWSVADRSNTKPDQMSHDQGIAAIAISKDGTRLVAEGSDDTGKIWWLKDRTHKELKGLTGPSSAIAFSPNGKFVASEGTIDEGKPGWVVLVWDAEDPSKDTPLQILQGHTSAVTALDFSAADGCVAAGGEDGTVLVWDPITGKPKWTLPGHTADVNSVSFDKSGNRLLTASSDGTARVWDETTGKELLKLSGHLGMVTGAIFSDDGQRILTIGRRNVVGGSPEDNLVRVWDANTGALFLIIGGHTSWINAASFSSNGKMIVTASRDGTAQLWNARTGRHLMALKGHSGAVLDASFSPDDKSVLTMGADQSVHIWTIGEEVLAPKIDFAGNITSVSDEIPITVAFDSQQQIATVAADGAIGSWDPKALEPNKTEIPSPLKNRSNPIYQDIKKSPDGRYIAVALSDVPDPGSKESIKEATKAASIVQVWDTKVKNYIPLDAGGEGTPIYTLEFSPKGKYLLASGKDGTATLWETASWKPHRLEIEPVPADKDHSEAGLILAAAFDSTEQWVATGHDSGFVEVFATGDQKNLNVFAASTGAINSIAFGRGTELITGGGDGTAALWTIDGKNLAKIDHKFPVLDAKFSDNGSFVITGCTDSIIRVWENPVSNGVTKEERRPSYAPVNLVAKFEALDTPWTIALSRDNLYLAVGSSRGLLQVFTCEACRPFEELKSEAIKKNPRQLTKPERVELLGPDEAEVPKRATAGKKTDESKKKK